MIDHEQSTLLCNERKWKVLKITFSCIYLYQFVVIWLCFAELC